MNRNRNRRSFLARFRRADTGSASSPMRISTPTAWRALLAAGTVGVLAVLMSVHFLPDRVSLRIGDRSPMAIRATRSVSYVDSEATLHRKELAADQVEPVYDFDRSALGQASDKVAEIFRVARSIRENPSMKS